jgi:UDP-N-acetylmuramoylalanine--D-glutamate ligase
MKDAVARAIKKAHTGDIVLLSPGCSSFDMFEDYVERGNQFKRIVASL